MITIEREPASPSCVARIRGDIDFAVVPELRAVLGAAIGDGCTNVVIDLTEVTYADSSALGLLVWIDKRLQPYDGKLVLAGAGRDVSRILELSGLVGVAPSVRAAASVGDALSQLDTSIERGTPLWVERIEAPAFVGGMSLVRARVVELLEPLGMPDSDVFDVKVAIGEALANAVRHGSPLGEADVVIVQIAAFDDYVELMISDAGRGFDGQATCDTDVYAAGGRGIVFMRALMDKVDFLPCSGGGTTVRLVKHRRVVHASAERR